MCCSQPVTTFLGLSSWDMGLVVPSVPANPHHPCPHNYPCEPWVQVGVDVAISTASFSFVLMSVWISAGALGSKNVCHARTAQDSPSIRCLSGTVPVPGLQQRTRLTEPVPV